MPEQICKKNCRPQIFLADNAKARETAEAASIQVFIDRLLQLVKAVGSRRKQQ